MTKSYDVAIVGGRVAGAATAMLLAVLAPFLAQVWRKRSLRMGIYSIALINLHGVGFVAGLLRRRIDPTTPIESVVLHEPEEAVHA